MACVLTTKATYIYYTYFTYNNIYRLVLVGSVLFSLKLRLNRSILVFLKFKPKPNRTKPNREKIENLNSVRVVLIGPFSLLIFFTTLISTPLASFFYSYCFSLSFISTPLDLFFFFFFFPYLQASIFLSLFFHSSFLFLSILILFPLFYLWWC